MPQAIPPQLAPYLESNLSSPHDQILITSVLSTPSPWLLLRFIYAALYGVGDDVETRDLAAGGVGSTRGTTPVVLVSLLRPLSLWVEMGKKIGLDLHTLLRSQKIVYIDGLVYGPAPTVSGDASVPPTTRLKGLNPDDLRYALESVLKSLSTSTSSAVPPASTSSGLAAHRAPVSSVATSSTSTEHTKPILLLDGVDFLLACQPSLSAVSLQTLLSSLRTRCQALVLTCNADAPLMQAPPFANQDVGTPLERNHAHLLTSSAHHSRWVFQLRGLDTGSAKDVSGVMRVSRGGASMEEDEASASDFARSGVKNLFDAEWLYQLKGDGSVRVWGRGE